MSQPRNPNEDMQARYNKAVKTLLNSVDQVAEEMVAGKIGWHGKLAVATALLESIEANFSDNAHDDPGQYEEWVEDMLNPASDPYGSATCVLYKDFHKGDGHGKKT